MITTNNVGRTILVAALSAGLLAGCGAMSGKAAPPLLAKREIPGVILCMSQRTVGGGLRLVGKVDPGIYPITRATIEYRSAGVSDAVPAVVDPSSKRFELTGSRSEPVKYARGSSEVVFVVSPQNARTLQGKSLWYRWTLTYDKGGSMRTDQTEIHRTSLEEAGVPRDVGALGPDASVALPVARKR